MRAKFKKNLKDTGSTSSRLVRLRGSESEKFKETKTPQRLTAAVKSLSETESEMDATEAESPAARRLSSARGSK